MTSKDPANSNSDSRYDQADAHLQVAGEAANVHTVAVLAFEQISPFHLAIPCAVFGEVPLGAPRFRVLVCACEAVPLATSVGFKLMPEHGLEALAQAQTIIVPSWRANGEVAPQALLAALVAAHQRGAQVVGLCLGAYVLAQAGLLAGRRATTHWAYTQDFARRFPDVQVDADVLYIEDGGVLTSAGTAAGLDCCLHLVRRICGAEHANRLARYLVVQPHRQGGQAQFIEQPLPVSRADSRLGDLFDWLRANLHLPHSVDTLAEKSLMSRRSFTRHFRQQTGTTVTHWLLVERLALAQRLLETTSQSVEQVAALAGFGSTVSLRQHFRQAFGVSPSHWRHSFER